MVTDTSAHGRIEVRGLTKSFGSVHAVDDLSFTVEPGEVTGFLGPNGAGKTTTLRILLGLIRPDAGSATIGGRTYTTGGRVGAALEATGFHPGRSGRNHLLGYCRLQGYPAAHADEILDLVGLTAAARRPVRGYSLGMRQRLALAGALLGDPPVLILDEPGNGLDPEGIAWLRRLLRRLACEGRTVLVSSHVLSEVQQLVDRVVIVNRGRLVRQGRIADLAAGSDEYQAVSVRTPTPGLLVPVIARAAGPDATADVTGPDTLEVTGLTAARIGDLAFDSGVRLHELTPRRRDLEDVFLALTTTDGSEGS